MSDLERAAEEVHQVTGLPAPATVPDAALAEADEIRFLDNSPEALRKRLGHGNIYPPGQADAALGGLFRTETLAALREIGLRVVAETLTAPGRAQSREPLDVLVAVTDPAQAEALVLRGARLARRGNAACTVLTLGPAAGRPGDGDAAIRAAARDAGAGLLAREGTDSAALIAQAVRETGARHLVLAVPPAGLLERWRPGLAERLASELPDIHLHLTEGRPGPHRAGGNGAATPDAVPAAGKRPRGTVRVYLGYAAGCGITSAMLEEAGRRRARGRDVVIAAVDCRGREGVSAALDGLETIGDGTSLDAAAVLARRPEVACIDDLAAIDASGGSRFAAARRLAGAGITIVGTVHLDSLRPGDGPAGDGAPGDGAAGVGAPGDGAPGDGAAGDGAAGDGAAGDGAAGDGAPVGSASDTLDEAAILSLADEIELVDAPPSLLADRVRRGEIVPAAGVEEALRTDYSPQTLGAKREQAFTVVAEHADRRLAAYRGRAGSESRPRILGCAAPRPGMEPLIRRSAALAAQMAGDFLVSAVTHGPPSADLKPVLAAYAALTSQLGGQFAALQGSPAAALAQFARQHQVTEMVLARGPGAGDGRHRVLSELARQAGDAEVHVLPAQAR